MRPRCRIVWLFLSYGGWRDIYTAVLEPCTNMPKDLADAVRLGQSARLTPGEEFVTTVSVTLSGAAGGQTMRRILGVIPARMGSSRFPGKPLARIRGRPMMEHVYRGTAACPLLDEVVIATCDERSPELREGSGQGRHDVGWPRTRDRPGGRGERRDTAEIVVMVQGDEPMVQPDMIAASVEALLARRDCRLREPRSPDSFGRGTARPQHHQGGR